MVNAQWFQKSCPSDHLVLASISLICTQTLAATRITLQSDSKVAAADAAEKAKLAEHAEQFEGMNTTMHTWHEQALAPSDR